MKYLRWYRCGCGWEGDGALLLGVEPICPECLEPADALVARQSKVFIKRGDVFRARCMGVHGERQCRRAAVTKDRQWCAACAPAVAEERAR